MKRIICTVTNDLNYDQRMIRICTSLAKNGYEVVLVGRKMKGSPPLNEQPFLQKRLKCFAQKGKWFYAEYNIRLFFFLLFCKADCFCAIDLDTILPVYWVSGWRNKKRVYDAHELFCEMEEIVSRPWIYKMWKWIERTTVPHFEYGYTIGDLYREEFERMYNVHYEVVRNATVLKEENVPGLKKEKHIFYQGALNEGRCFEYLLPAMCQIDVPLIICGKGNFWDKAREMIETLGLKDKVFLKGYVQPEELKAYTKKAYIGVTLFEAGSKSNYYSMGNRFFDYMHWGVPQLCVSYPEYKRVNQKYELACLLEEVDTESIVKGLQKLLQDDAYYERLKDNALRARQEYNWQNEEKKLLTFYNRLFG